MPILSELLMLNARFVWSQNSQNPVSISLSRESCSSHPGVIFMVGWLRRIPSCQVMSFSQIFSEPTPTAGHVVNAEELVVVQDNRDLASRYCIDFSKS